MNSTQSNTVDAAPGAALTPQQIIDYNQAFAMSLQTLQGPAAQERTEILNLIVDVLQQLIKLSGEALNIHSVHASIENLKHHAEEARKAAAVAHHESSKNASASSSDWFQAMMHALAVAQENAVSTQQQLNLIGNAALTEGLAILMSIVPVVVGKSVNEAEPARHSSPGT